MFSSDIATEWIWVDRVELGVQTELCHVVQENKDTRNRRAVYNLVNCVAPEDVMLRKVHW